QLQSQLRFNLPNTSNTYSNAINAQAVGVDSPLSSVPSKTVDLDWDNIGFGFVNTDYMYVTKCSIGESFSKGELVPFGNIEINPAAGVLNYGQALFEGLKAYRTEDGNILLFRPEENGTRMINGAERMCMPAPSVDQFVQAVKATVLANERWIPPPGKGSLYIRPLLMGSGSVLGLAPAPEYTFLIYVSPVGNYFKEGLSPINLLVETEMHRATPGGTGGVKTIGNYAAVLKAQGAAKAKGYSDVLYLDSVEKKYLEEVSSCNIFIVKGNTISTPDIKGTILPGITRKSIIDVARDQGFQVFEKPVTVDALLDADEVFCTGTAVVVSPVGSITYLGKRRKLFSRYLKEQNHSSHEAVAKMRPFIPKLKWRTSNNHVDCGVFAMIHMENYVGDAAKNWEFNLCEESDEQLSMLHR
ncbi:branched-chain amino acid aminotransferase 2, chloroplastic-like protein isoform X2, partial [Tanacetum coccineum]